MKIGYAMSRTCFTDMKNVFFSMDRFIPRVLPKYYWN